MSTLNVTNLTDGTTTVTTQAVIAGFAKSWMNLNGTGSIAVRASFNTTSVTDNGTGDYTKNFTSAMTDANYATVRAADANGAVDSTAVTTLELLSVLTSSVRLWSGAGATPADVLRYEVSVFR